MKVLEQRWIAQAGPLPTGVRIDPIMDLARIIRVIGTINWKGTVIEGRPHRRSCFIALPMLGGRQQLVAEQLRNTGVPLVGNNEKKINPMVRGDLGQFQECEFVKWIHGEAANIPEPAWMDFLTQCAWLEGGDEVAHRLSELDTRRYSHRETQSRLDRIRRVGYRPKHCHRLVGAAGFFECPCMQACSASRPVELAVSTREKDTCFETLTSPDKPGSKTGDAP
jgi:hypothetical protein